MPEIHYLQESHILIFLLQILLLLGLARAFGEILRRFHQPPFPAEIFVGILLGPTILGRYFPSIHSSLFPGDAIQQAMLETVSWLGVFFLLLQTGLEIDFSKAWRQRGAALTIALVDIIVPMIVAFIPCYFLISDNYLVNPENRLSFSLFIATCMTISAMPVAARALHDLKLLKTNMGFLIMSALSVNDIVGWLIFTMVLGFSTQVDVNVGRLLLVFGCTIAFTVICLTIGRKFANTMVFHFKKNQMPEPASSLTFICIMGLACGAFTQWIGIHALFGFFIAGIVVGEAQALTEKTRHIISQLIFAVIVPLFFANIGLKIDFFRNFDLFIVLFISLLGVTGRFLGAWIGAAMSKTPVENRLPIAVAHTTGGAMEIVVGTLALELNVISEKIFIAIIIGAIFSSILYGPWMSWAIRLRKKVSILEFFPKSLIVTEMRADSVEHAIEELSELVGEEETIDDDEIAALVKTREELMGTALEDSIAIPHARVSGLQRPVIAFGRSLAGIDWNSPDGLPSHFIFLVLVPEDMSDIHVQILQSIATVMSDEELRSILLHADNRQKLWSVLEQAFINSSLKQRH